MNKVIAERGYLVVRTMQQPKLGDQIKEFGITYVGSGVRSSVPQIVTIAAETDYADLVAQADVFDTRPEVIPPRIGERYYRIIFD